MSLFDPSNLGKILVLFAVIIAIVGFLLITLGVTVRRLVEEEDKEKRECFPFKVYSAMRSRKPDQHHPG
jgi:uncharacterized membrane protein